MASMTSAATSSSGMDMGGGCQISMLWNWNTIDACFISESWRITSRGMFAGSCIGVVLLVMCLEALRRLSKEYDRYILKCFRQDFLTKKQGSSTYKQNPTVANVDPTNGTTTSTDCCSNNDISSNSRQQYKADDITTTTPTTMFASTGTIHFRPSPTQQSIRALLHMVTFAIAYFVMLLAMYYNGYFIICIFIGAYLGAFVFSWESIGLSTTELDTGGISAAEDVTVCCG